jgi:hypothetical protein
VRTEEDNRAPRKLPVSSFDCELPHCHSHPRRHRPPFAVVCDDCSCVGSVGSARAVSDSHYALQTHHHQQDCHFADLVVTLDRPRPE